MQSQKIRIRLKASSSIGRASVSKTEGWGFETLLACHECFVSREVSIMAKDSTSKTIDSIKWIISLSFFTLAVVGNSYFVETAFLYRVLGVVFLFILGLVALAFTNFGSNAIKLMRESRTEIRKVVWPTRVETSQTFMVVLASIVVLILVLWGIDSLLRFLTQLVLG